MCDVFTNRCANLQSWAQIARATRASASTRTRHNAHVRVCKRMSDDWSHARHEGVDIVIIYVIQTERGDACARGDATRDERTTSLHERAHHYASLYLARISRCDDARANARASHVCHVCHMRAALRVVARTVGARNNGLRAHMSISIARRRESYEHRHSLRYNTHRRVVKCVRNQQSANRCARLSASSRIHRGRRGSPRMGVSINFTHHFSNGRRRES